MGRSLVEEGLIAKLAFGGSESFFEFGEFFGQALALGGDVDGLFVDDLDVELGRGTDGGSLGGIKLAYRLDLRNSGRVARDLEFSVKPDRGLARCGRDEAFSSTPISLRRARTETMSSWRARSRSRRRLLQWRSSRITSKCDGFRRCLAFVECVPQLLSQEGHEGREQAQSGLEDLEERGECGLRCGFVCGSAKSRRSLTISRYQSQKSPQKNW